VTGLAGSPESVYVDSSIIGAIVDAGHPHYEAAGRWADQETRSLQTSVLAEVEVKRALLRREALAGREVAAARAFDQVDRIDVTGRIRQTAVEVRPASVRSLDALHVATALISGAAWFASLDERQRVAAEEMGLRLVEIR